MRTYLAVILGSALAFSVQAQQPIQTQTWQQHWSGVVTWGAVQKQTQTQQLQHSDVFDIDGSLIREVYLLTHTHSTYRVRWQDRTHEITRQIFDDGSYQDQERLIYQKTAVRLHDRTDTQQELRERLVLSSPQAQPSHDPVDYQAQRYYFNHPALGRPSTVHSHDPADWLDTESLNRANDIVRANWAWSRGWTGQGSGILIMDTGIDLDHPEFQDRIRGWIDLSGRGMRDRQNHGTHVAGIAAAARDGRGINGVAFDADLYIAKLTDNGSVSAVRAQQALVWAQQFPGIRVANLSANTQFNRDYINSVQLIAPGVYRSNHARYQGPVFYNMERPQDWARALSPGVVLTVSAGNQNLPYPQNPASFAAAVDAQGNLILRGQMLIVGNWNDRAGRIESARAGHVCRDMHEGRCQDPYRTSDFYILAPGMSVSSTSDGDLYRSQSGSSQAAPVVAGAVAIIGQMWPYMPADQVVQLLLRTARRDLPGYAEDTHGQGLLDLDQATRPLGHLGIRVQGRNNERQPLSGSIAVAGVMVPSTMAVLDDLDRDFQIRLPSTRSVARWDQVELPGSASWVAQAARVQLQSLPGVSAMRIGSRADDWAMLLEQELGHGWAGVTSLAQSQQDPLVHFRGMWGNSTGSRMVSQDIRWRSGNTMLEAGWIRTYSRHQPGLISRISAIDSIHARWIMDYGPINLQAGFLPRAINGHVTFTLPDRMDESGQMRYRDQVAAVQDQPITYAAMALSLGSHRTGHWNIHARLDSLQRLAIQLRGNLQWQ